MLLGLSSSQRAPGDYLEAHDALVEGLQEYSFAAQLEVFCRWPHHLGQHQAAMLRLLVQSSSNEEIKRYQAAIGLDGQDLSAPWSDAA